VRGDGLEGGLGISKFITEASTALKDERAGREMMSVPAKCEIDDVFSSEAVV